MENFNPSSKKYTKYMLSIVYAYLILTVMIYLVHSLGKIINNNPIELILSFITVSVGLVLIYNIPYLKLAPEYKISSIEDIVQPIHALRYILVLVLVFINTVISSMFTSPMSLINHGFTVGSLNALEVASKVGFFYNHNIVFISPEITALTSLAIYFILNIIVISILFIPKLFIKEQ